MSDLTEKLAQAVEAYKAMSPVEQALHDSDQRRSFIRSGLGGAEARRDLLADEVRRQAELIQAMQADQAELLDEIDRLRSDISNYAAATTEANAEINRLRSVMVDACDLLAERKHANPARSAAHNGRLILEDGLRIRAANAPAEKEEG